MVAQNLSPGSSLLIRHHDVGIMGELPDAGSIRNNRMRNNRKFLVDPAS